MPYSVQIGYINSLVDHQAAGNSMVLVQSKCRVATSGRVLFQACLTSKVSHWLQPFDIH
jgi:hypothetical protein